MFFGNLEHVAAFTLCHNDIMLPARYNNYAVLLYVIILYYYYYYQTDECTGPVCFSCRCALHIVLCRNNITSYVVRTCIMLRMKLCRHEFYFNFCLPLGIDTHITIWPFQINTHWCVHNNMMFTYLLMIASCNK